MDWIRSLALSTLVSAAVLAGCSHEPKRPTPPPEQPRAAAPAAPTPAAADREFVMKAADGGLAEVDLGKLAQRKSKNAQVKRFGKRMVKDHSAANQQLMEIARAENMPAPGQLSAEHKRAHEDLGRLKGKAFDRAYMKAQLEDHEQTIELFRTEAASGRNERLAAFARQTLPTLEEHLAMARKVAKAVGVKNEE